MDITTILLIIGGIIIACVLIWAVVAVISLAVFRKASKDITKDFGRGFDSDFFKRN